MMASNSEVTGQSANGNQRESRGIEEQATYFMQSYITESFESENVNNAPTLGELRDGEEELPEELDEAWRQAGGTFRQIAKIVDKSAEFQSIVDSLPDNPSIDDIINFVKKTLSYGKINWGVIVAIYCFTYRVCAKKLEYFVINKYPNFSQWASTLVIKVVKLLLDNFLDWIINRGGWQSMKDYFNRQHLIRTAVIVAVTFAAIGFGVYIWRKKGSSSVTVYQG